MAAQAGPLTNCGNQQWPLSFVAGEVATTDGGSGNSRTAPRSSLFTDSFSSAGLQLPTLSVEAL